MKHQSVKEKVYLTRSRKKISKLEAWTFQNPSLQLFSFCRLPLSSPQVTRKIWDIPFSLVCTKPWSNPGLQVVTRRTSVETCIELPNVLSSFLASRSRLIPRQTYSLFHWLMGHLSRMDSGHTMKNLRRVACKFGLDQSERKKTQSLTRPDSQVIASSHQLSWTCVETCVGWPNGLWSFLQIHTSP